MGSLAQAKGEKMFRLIFCSVEYEFSKKSTPKFVPKCKGKVGEAIIELIVVTCQNFCN